jgi:hypothetical protein
MMESTLNTGGRSSFSNLALESRMIVDCFQPGRSLKCADATFSRNIRVDNLQFRSIGNSFV